MRNAECGMPNERITGTINTRSSWLTGGGLHFAFRTHWTSSPTERINSRALLFSTMPGRSR